MSNVKMHVKNGDTVMVISGKEKGRQGKVQTAFPKDNKVIVANVAVVKRHEKSRGQGMPGGVHDKEAAIPASKVMLVCPKCGKPTRVAHKVLEDGKKKVRVCKRCGAAFDN